MADTTKTSLLIVQAQTDGVDDAKASVAALGGQVDKTIQSVSAMSGTASQQQAALTGWASTLDSASNHLGGIAQKLDLTSRAAGGMGLAFDGIGWDPAAAGASQMSGRLQEVASGFDALSQATALASSVIGTHTDELGQAVDQYHQVSAAQNDSAESSDLSTAAWIAAGIAAVTVVGVGAGLIVALGAISDGMDAATAAAEKWAEELITGGVLDNMQALIASGHELNDLSTTTGIAAENFSTLATGLQGSGLSADTTKTMMTGLAATLTGTGDSAVKTRAALADMGIDVQSLGKNGNDVQAVFLAIASVLSGYQDGAQKTAIAQELLGASSAEAINGIDGVVAAFGRMDEQTRGNIANTAAFTAEIQKQIAAFKDLRDNTPATLGQSQFSNGIARVGAGAQQIGAAGFGGLFSSAGRTEIGAGFSNIGSGLSNIDSDIELQVSQAAMALGAKVDNIFGTNIAKAVQDHIDDVTAEIAATAAKATPDMRSPPPPPAEGSVAWAGSAGTNIVAQYDTGTAALVTFTMAYAKLEDDRKQGLITEDQETQAVGRLAAAYADAIGPFDKYLQQQQDALAIRQKFTPGPQRDLETAAAAAKAQYGDQYNDSAFRQSYSAGQTQDTGDKTYLQTQQQIKALADLHTKNQEAAADSALVAVAWTQSAQAGLLAEAQTQSLAAARSIDKNAASNQADVITRLTSSYDDALKGGAQYIQQLKDQADAAAAAAAAAGGDPESVAQAAITAQVQQQYATELAKAQVLDAQLGTDTNTLDVMQQMTTAAALLANIHDSQIAAALKSELASTIQALTDEQALFDIGGKRLATSKEEAAVQQEIANLRAKGITDLTTQAAQQDLMNVRETQALKDQADAQQKAADEADRQVRKVSDQIERTVSTDIYDVLSGKQISLWQTFEQLGFHAIADIAAKMLETQFIMPVVADILGTVSGTPSGSSNSGASNALSILSTGSSASSALGGQSLGGYLGLTGEGGSLAGASSYLFGTSATTVGSSTVAGLETPAFTVAGTDGAIGSGGLSGTIGTVAPYAAPVIAGGLAGYGLGEAVGSPGGGALAGAAGGAATGALIGTFVLPVIGTLAGAVIGGIAGAIGGAIGGQHPSVGPNSGGYVNYKNGTATVGLEASDNGGNDQIAIEMQKAAVAAFNSLSASTGGTLSGVPDLRVGTFNGKYFGTTDTTGGTAANATYTNEADAVANGVLMALKQSDLSKVDPNVKTAIGNIAQGTDATTISNDLTFAEQFSAAINAMKGGVVDFTQAAETAAETTSAQLVTSIENFRTQTAALGLDTQAAADATKAAVSSFLGLTQTQPVSALESSVQTLYGKLEGVAGLLSAVGLSQDDVTAKVKAQVEQMAGITTAIPANAIATEVSSIKQTFTDLGSTFKALGITADQVTQGLQANLSLIQQSVAADLASRNNAAQGLGILNTLQTAITQHNTDMQNANAAGLGDSGANAANDVFNNTVFSSLNQLAGNTTALDAVINAYAKDTSDAGKLIEVAAKQVEAFGAVAVTAAAAVNSVTSAAEQQGVMSRLYSSEGLSVLNTLASAVAQQNTDTASINQQGLGPDVTAAANQTFDNNVFTAINGLAGNTAALDAVINQYATDTSTAGKFIESAAVQVKNFGAVMVGVSQSASTAASNINTWLTTNLTGSLSALSPKDQFAATQSQFNTDLAGAKSGNVTDEQNITTDANAYLKSAQGLYASSSQYAQIYAQVMSQVSTIPGVDPSAAVIAAISKLQSSLTGIDVNTGTIATNTTGLDNAIRVAVNLDLVKQITLSAINDLASVTTDTLTNQLLVTSGKEYSVTIDAINSLKNQTSDVTSQQLLTSDGKSYSIAVSAIDNLIVAESDPALKNVLSKDESIYSVTVGVEMANWAKLTPAQQSAIAATNTSYSNSMTQLFTNWAQLTPTQQSALLAENNSYVNTLSQQFANWGSLSAPQQAALLAQSQTYSNTMTQVFSNWGALTPAQQAALLAETDGYTKTLTQTFSGLDSATPAELAALTQQSQTVIKTINQDLTVNGQIVDTSSVNGTIAIDLQSIGLLSYSNTTILHTDLQAIGNMLYTIGIQTNKVVFNTGQSAARLGGIPAYAAGGDFGGGLRIVGERGIELEATGPSRIWDSSTTKSMLGGGASSDGGSAAILSGMRTDNRYAYASMVRGQESLIQLTQQLILEQRATLAALDRQQARSAVA